MIPEGWLISTLENLIDIKHGFAFKSDYFRSEGEYILTTPGHFFEVGGFRDQGNKTKYYVGEVPKEYILKKGDVLLAMTEQAAGLLGSAMYVPDSNKYLHNQRLGLVVVLDHERVCKEYIYLIYNSHTTRKIIAEQASGTKVKHTSPSRLLGVNVLIPPLSEQKKISKILSIWDKAITTTEQLLTNSQQQKKSLMQQLLTGNKRFPEFNERWENRSLSEICILGAGQPAPQGEKYFINGNHDFLRVSDLGLNTSRWAPQSRDKINELAIRECKLELVPAKATLFTKSGASLLLNQRAQLKDSSYIVSHLGFAKAKDCISDDFVFYLMCSIDFNHYAAGTSLPALQLSVLKSLKVLIPPYEEQKKIAAMLSDADVEISILEKTLFFLKQEKKTLMQQLLTGKRRVKTEAA